MKIKLLTFLLVFVVMCCCAGAGDWPGFRGASGTGVIDSVKPPLVWSDTENILWKIPVPGKGHSSPVVMGGYIYLTAAFEENVRKEKYGNNICFWADRITLLALCIDIKDGKIKWQTELFKVEKPDPVHTLNSFATPTPVVDDKRLYCDFGTYGTACLESGAGSVVWKKRLPLEHEVGPGSSTILYNNLLILVRDGCDVQYITALNKENGEEVWKTARPPVAGERTDMHKAFSSPIIFQRNGRTQLVAPCAQWIVSYDPLTGREYWRANHGRGFSIAAQPSEANGMVYFCTGFSGNQVMAIRHDGAGDVTKTHIAWEAKDFAPTIPSPIVCGDRIYWVQDSGTFCCVDSKTGEQIWKKKLSGRYYSSPIIADNRIYVTSQQGMTTVLEPCDEFKTLAVNELSGCEVMATPAFVGESIILRTDKNLYNIKQ